MPERRVILGLLSDWVLAAGTSVRLAIDGPDTAGKTTLADELGASISDGGRPVIRASIDGFHRPAAERYRRGELSAEGCYHDSFDVSRLRSYLLDPLGPGGSRIYRTASFDYATDQPVEVAEEVAADDAVLVFDGVFLQRPELAAAWDLVVFLEIGEDEVVRRAMSRDAPRSGLTVEERYLHRYLPAQRIYREVARPLDGADAVIDNTDPHHPVALKAPWQ